MAESGGMERTEIRQQFTQAARSITVLLPRVCGGNMTEAGWTHGKDLSAEGQSFMASVKVLIDAIEQEAYQQGRVAGLREAAKEVLRQATAIDAANKFNEMAEQLAQAAQDEKGVGDVHKLG